MKKDYKVSGLLRFEGVKIGYTLYYDLKLKKWYMEQVMDVPKKKKKVWMEEIWTDPCEIIPEELLDLVKKIHSIEKVNGSVLVMKQIMFG